MKKRNSNKPTFPLKTLPNKQPNPKYVDVLSEDKPLAGQGYGCFSFLSPEKILKKREMFFFEEFVKQWEINKTLEVFDQFMNFISFKYKLSYEDIKKDLEEFVKEERQTIVQSSNISNDYKNFLDKEEEQLDKKFNVEHQFQTSVRGVKARGNFATEEEANLRAKLLREIDDAHDIFVGKVGQWLVWDPEAYKTGDVVYMEEELNQLVHEKLKNEALANAAFEMRVKESKQQAIEENKLKQEKTGCVLTQDIDEHGNLIGVDLATKERKTEEPTTVGQLYQTLFEGDNIVTSTDTDHGQSELLSGPFAPSAVAAAANEAFEASGATDATEATKANNSDPPAMSFFEPR